VVHDVVGAGWAALHRGDRRARGVVDVDERPPRGPLAADREPPRADLGGDRAVGGVARARSVEIAIAQHHALEALAGEDRGLQRAYRIEGAVEGSGGVVI